MVWSFFLIDYCFLIIDLANLWNKFNPIKKEKEPLLSFYLLLFFTAYSNARWFLSFLHQDIFYIEKCLSAPNIFSLSGADQNRDNAFNVVGEVKKLSPCSQTSQRVYPTHGWSCSLPSRVSGSCMSSYFSSAVQRIPLPHGNAAPSQISVAKKHKDIHKRFEVAEQQDRH